MEKKYLYIVKREDGTIGINASDGIFSSYATLKNKEELEVYCDDRANQWLKSKLGNFDGWNKQNRRLIADKWLSVKCLQEGKYECYFNIENLEDVFRAEVAALAKSMGIYYTLEIKKGE